MKKKYLVQDVISVMQEIAPTELALDYDTVGLMIGDTSSEVKKLVLALDISRESVAFAVKEKADMIVTHHPMFFNPVSRIDYSTPQGANIRTLIQNNISVFAAHTKLDRAKTGVNQALGETLNLVMPITLQDTEVGICGSVGNDSMKLFAYADMVKEKLGASGLILNTDQDKEVSRVFLQGGAFDEDVIPVLKQYRVDVVVTGEMKHHHMLELEDAGIAVIVAGHEVTERIVLPSLQEQLLRKLPNLAITVYEGHKW